MLSVDDWAEIRRLQRCEVMPIRAIARKLGVGRNTVRRALAADGPPRYVRKPKGSIVDSVEPQVRELLAVWPDMPATVIAERIGWQRSVRVLRNRVAVLRPLFAPPDPVSRTVYQPGELAQCDLWFPPADVPLGFGQAGRPPVLVMVCGYSRWVAARMLPSRQGPDLLAGHWLLLRQLGAVPRALVWDNESAVGRWRGGRPELTEAMNAFRGALGITVIQCRPADPEAKGLVSGLTGIWRPRSCQAGCLLLRLISTLSWRCGWRRPKGGIISGSDAVLRTGCPLTWPRWWPCRRWPRRPGGGLAPGCPASTTCGWPPATTRFIPAPSAAWWR